MIKSIIPCAFILTFILIVTGCTPTRLDNRQHRIEVADAALLTKDNQTAARLYKDLSADASSPHEKAIWLVHAGQSLNLIGKHHEAGQLADQAIQLEPQNVAIAAYRLNWWRAAGEIDHAAAAEDHLKRLDANVQGKEVIEPFTICAVVVVTGVVVTYVTTSIIKSINDPNYDPGRVLSDLRIALGIVGPLRI